MKLRKNIFKLSVLAGIICCLLVAGTFLAAGSAAPAAVDESKLNLMLTVSTDEEVAKDGTFTATVKVANQNIKDLKIAGLQVFLNFDADKLTATADDIKPALDSESAVAKNVVNNQVRFVCVKEEFTDDAGYETLGELFTVTFKANATIANPAKLFDENSIEFVVGDTYALAIDVDALYGANAGALAEAIITGGYTLEPTDTTGTVVIIPAEALTAAGLEAAVVGSVVTSTNGIVGTGATITINEGTEDEESLPIVVKGDVDGDGLVTVFDAAIMIKESFVGKDLQGYAAEKDNQSGINGGDAAKWLEIIVGK